MDFSQIRDARVPCCEGLRALRVSAIVVEGSYASTGTCPGIWNRNVTTNTGNLVDFVDVADVVSQLGIREVIDR